MLSVVRVRTAWAPLRESSRGSHRVPHPSSRRRPGPIFDLRRSIPSRKAKMDPGLRRDDGCGVIAFGSAFRRFLGRTNTSLVCCDVMLYTRLRVGRTLYPTAVTARAKRNWHRVFRAKTATGWWVEHRHVTHRAHTRMVDFVSSGVCRCFFCGVLADVASRRART